MAQSPSEKREKRIRRWLSLPASMWEKIDRFAVREEREDYNDMIRVVLKRWLENNDEVVAQAGSNLDQILKFLAIRAKAAGMKLGLPEDRPSPKAVPKHKGTQGKE